MGSTRARSFLVVAVLGSLTAWGADPPRDWPCVHLMSSGDKPPTQSKRYTFDGPGKCTTPPDLDLVGCPTTEEAYDGTKLLRKRTFAYDAGGKLVTSEYFRDGKLTTRLTVTWDAKGAPLKTEIDRGPDGTVDELVEFRKQGKDLVVERKSGGKAETRWTYHFDKAGRVTVVDTDRFADGKLLLKTTTTWEGAHRVKDETIAVANGKLISRTTFQDKCD